MMSIRVLAMATIVLAAGSPANAATVEISASQDNTLYESASGTLSNGGGDYVHVGRTLSGDIRRGLIAFDVAASLPAGSTITSAELQLSMSRTRGGTESVALHPLLADWGEGASHASGQEGGGATASAGDATWLHTFFSTDFWSTAGGDFDPAPTATVSVGGVGLYAWPSSVPMVSLVQDWLDTPAQNFGWAIVGNEAASETTKRFDSRTNVVTANQPKLTVEFTPPAVCGDGFLGPGEVCDPAAAGNGCCSPTCDSFQLAGTVCRGAAGFCDVAEMCSGTDAVCPPDSKSSALCRGAVDGCDLAESCDGVNDDCPADDVVDCDDGLPCTVDACDPGLGCQNVAEPMDASQCLVALKTKLKIKDSDKIGKDQVQWQWKKGEAFDQASVGTPLVGTTYALCVYDHTAAVANLALDLEVASSPTLWDDKSPKGAKYKDKEGTSDGVIQLQLKSGDDTKTKVKLKAKGLNLVLPGPVGGTYFDQDPSVIAQLVNSEGECWTTEFEPADNKKHDAEQFKSLTK